MQAGGARVQAPDDDGSLAGHRLLSGETKDLALIPRPKFGMKFGFRLHIQSRFFRVMSDLAIGTARCPSGYGAAFRSS